MTDQVSHNEIYLMLGRLEGKVDAFLSKAAEQEKRQPKAGKFKLS